MKHISKRIQNKKSAHKKEALRAPFIEKLIASFG